MANFYFMKPCGLKLLALVFLLACPRLYEKVAAQQDKNVDTGVVIVNNNNSGIPGSANTVINSETPQFINEFPHTPIIIQSTDPGPLFGPPVNTTPQRIPSPQKGTHPPPSYFNSLQW